MCTLTQKTMMMSLAMAAMLALTLLSAPAHAAKPKKAAATASEEETAAMEAKAHYQKEDYEKAGALFAIAYAKWRRPTHLFNAARSYQSARMLQRAAELFREYLKLPDAEETGKLEAKAHLDAIEAELRPQAAGPSASEPPRDPGVNHEVIVEEPLPPPPSRALPYSLIGGGAALLLGSGAGLLIAEGRMADANSMDFGIPNAEDLYQEKAASADSIRTWSYVGFGMGATALGYGLYQLFTEPEHPKQKKQIKIVPVVAPSAAGVAIRF